MQAIKLAVAMGLCLSAALAGAQQVPSTGCAAKTADIQNQLSIARQHGNDRRAAGLEHALEAAKACTDSSLQAEREDKVRDAARKVQERQKELAEEQSENDAKGIVKARDKLADAERGLTAAQAELMQ